MVLIFDLDGVVNIGDRPIPGAVETLNALQEAGHRLFFLTNNSTRSREHYVEKLARLGHPTSAEHIVTSAFATGLYMKSIDAAGKRVYVVGEHGLEAELKAAGLEVVALEDPTPVDFVVAGLDRQFHYGKLRRAHYEITRNGATFIVTNRDATYPSEEGQIPGGGSIVAPIEVASGVRGITIGKPEPGVWQRILEFAGVAPAEALMTGDRADTDIQGAKAVGLHTVLVLTGVTTAERVPQLPEAMQPEFVLPDLTSLPSVIAQLEGR